MIIDELLKTYNQNIAILFKEINLIEDINEKNLLDNIELEDEVQIDKIVGF
ncbi:32717_t:CDS:1, partial [Racocetra persica]